MKLKFAVYIMMVMLSARSALAIQTPSGTEIDDIQDQIYAANRMDKQIGIAEQLLRDAESMKRSAEQISGLKKQVVREKEKKNAARTKAIHMTILAYGLEPASWSGTSVMPWTKRRTIHWQPVAREREARQIQNADGKLRNVKQESDYVGITYADGVTVMDPSAFEKGPGYLASYLLHERIHFEQFTTDGKGNAMTYAEAQKEAYQAQADNAANFFDPKIRPADLRMMQDIERLRDDEVAKVDLETKANKGLRGLIRRLLPPAAPPEIFESKVHTNAELADISGLVAQARGQADIARREREAREANARAAAEKVARHNHDERLKRTYADIAIRSCANPGSVTQAELDSLPDPYQEDLQMSGGLPQSLDLCAQNVYYMLHRGVDAERIRERAAPLVPIAARPVPSGPQQAAGTAITSFRSILPTIRAYAESSCRSPGTVPVPAAIKLPVENVHFLKMDDNEIVRLSAGLGQCDLSLFRRLIEVIRLGQGRNVTSDWVAQTARSYMPAPVPKERSSSPPRSSPPHSSPPTGCIPGDNSRRNCIACGNKYCG